MATISSFYIVNNYNKLNNKRIFICKLDRIEVSSLKYDAKSLRGFLVHLVLHVLPDDSEGNSLDDIGQQFSLQPPEHQSCNAVLLGY